MMKFLFQLIMHCWFVFLTGCSSSNDSQPVVEAEAHIEPISAVPSDPPVADNSSITLDDNSSANEFPVAKVLGNLAVTENSSLLLDGSSSFDEDGNIASYLWTQTSGSITVTLNNGSTPIASFMAPAVDADTLLTFQLLVTDDQGATDAVTLNVIITTSSSNDQITASIITSRTTCTAPCGVMFDATNSTSTGVSEPFHQLSYIWDYGDAGSTFQQRLGVNANKSISPIGAHVYDKAGSYTTTLTVVGNEGEEDTQTVTIVVNDASVVYADQTYCVSNTNQFSACPNQDINFHFNSFSVATQFITSLRFNQASRSTRILFRAGDTFIATHQLSIRELSAELLIASYGSGNRPVIAIDSAMTDNSIFFIHDSSEVTFTDINFAGNYNPTTGMGNHTIAIWFYLAVTDALVYRNQFSGMGMNVYPHGGANMTTGAPSQHTMVVDNHMINWQDYGLFGTFGYLSTLLANTIKQDPNAISGSEAKCGTCMPNYPDHGPLRSSYSDHLLIQHNDMFNNAGWSTGGLAHQPNIRLGTGGTSIKSVISDNILEGGFTTVSMTPANPGAASAAVIADVIIERNQFTASDNTWQMIDMGIGGATIRNNLFLKPDNGAPSIGSGSFEAAIVFKVAADRTTAGNLTLTNRVYNNTLISLSKNTAPNLALIEVENTFSQFEIYNNIAYLPYITGNAEAGLLSWQYGAGLENVTSDNNILFAPNTQNFVWYSGVSLSLLDWNAQGNGNNSIVANPLLKDADNFDANLSTSSPAIDSGKAIDGMYTDFNNKARNNLIDVGSFEF